MSSSRSGDGRTCGCWPWRARPGPAPGSVGGWAGGSCSSRPRARSWCGRCAGRACAGAARTAVGALLVLAATGTVTVLRLDQVERGPVGALADDRAAVRVVGTVRSDPREVSAPLRRPGRHPARAPRGDRSRLVVRHGGAGARARRRRLARRAAGGAGAGGRSAGPGRRRRPRRRALRARPARGRGGPRTCGGVARPRSGRRSGPRSPHRPADQRALVPALVDGDDAGLDEALADDFRTTGLTHLLAVSGTNLTLVVGFLLVLARWAGLRGRALLVVGALGDRRLRPARPHRAERAPRRRDGDGRAVRDGRRRPATRCARPRRRGRGAAARAARPRRAAGLRAVGAGDRRDRAARPAPGATRWPAGCPGGSPRRSRSRRPPSWPARRWWPDCPAR